MNPMYFYTIPLPLSDRVVLNNASGKRVIVYSIQHGCDHCKQLGMHVVCMLYACDMHVICMWYAYM